MFLLVATSEDFSALLAAFEQDETFDIASAIAPRINGVKSDASFDFGAASLSRYVKTGGRNARARGLRALANPNLSKAGFQACDIAA
jgi:hypothetical protein